MKKLSRVALIAAVLVSSLAAKPAGQQRLPRPVAARQVPVPLIARPAMWKVADADTTIYLFGTVHALPKDMEWLDGPLATAFDQSQELVTEILESEGNDPKVIQSILDKAMLPPGQTLRAKMGPKARARLESILKANGAPINTLDRLEPWYAAVYLITTQMQDGGFVRENSPESVFGARAIALNRPHSALETMEYQMSLFDTLPEKTQLRLLSDTVFNMASAQREIIAMVDAWKRGDAARLAAIMNEDQSEPELMERMLIGRNRNWAVWVVQRLEKPGTVFVAVGAGHLAGKGSLQDQLAGKGIVSTRVQ